MPRLHWDTLCCICKQHLTPNTCTYTHPPPSSSCSHPEHTHSTSPLSEYSKGYSIPFDSQARFIIAGLDFSAPHHPPSFTYTCTKKHPLHQSHPPPSIPSPTCSSSSSSSSLSSSSSSSTPDLSLPQLLPPGLAQRFQEASQFPLLSPAA